MEKNYYDILGVSKDASKDDIRRAFKKLSIKYHPDKHINDSEEDKKKAEDKFKEINEAYETLSDDQKRQEYDNPMSGFGFNPFGFADFFGRGRQQNFIRPGQDIRVTVNLSIEDFYNNSIKEIKYKKNIRCGHCNGSGGKTETCTHCNGSGTIQKRYQRGNMITVHSEPCPHCHGQGKHIIETCDHCSGTGFKKEDRKFNIDIRQLHASMPSGDYTIDNFGGHESKQEGGQDGSLIARIIINLGRYKVGKNNDVFEQVEIPYYDMLLGVDKDIVLPNGKKIVVNIPEESKDGSVIKSKGNGINGADYYLCIKVIHPKLKKNDKELLKKIKKNH